MLPASWIGIVVLANYLKISSSEDLRTSCNILKEEGEPWEGEVIIKLEVRCGSDIVHVNLLNSLSGSELHVTGRNQNNNLISVIHSIDSRSLTVTFRDKTFNSWDDTDASVLEESEELQELIKDPEFVFFSRAVKLIHDRCKLKGWELPSVLFLYRLGMAAHSIQSNNNPHHLTKRLFFNLIPTVSSDILAYHGPEPAKECVKKGWSVEDTEKLLSEGCMGVCGPACDECWEWVCGDCCIHKGCLNHDSYCDKGWLEFNCLTARGVLWDTHTDKPFDC